MASSHLESWRQMRNYFLKKSPVSMILSIIISILALVALSNSKNNLTAKAAASSIYPYIKVAGPGTDLSSADQQWAAKHWDLTSSRKGQQAVYKTLNPNMKVCAYSTLSFFDTYGSNRTWQDWLVYANSNNLDPDVGLIHYKKDVSVTISKVGPREDKFSAVYVNPQSGTTNSNLNCKAYGDSLDTTHGCPWGGTNGALTLSSQAGKADYFAMETRFKEINFNVTTPSSGGWQAKWQYWNGSGWSDFSSISDTTSGLTTSGKIEFMPPPNESQWKRASSQSLNISTDTVPYYWIRQLVTSSGNAPTMTSTDNRPPSPVGQKGIWGQNYLTGADTGYTFNFPGWDPANDTNGDGVRDTDNNPGATATFKWQSRAPIWIFYPAQWVAFPGNSTFKNWITQWNKTNIADEQGSDGLFLDIQTTRIPDEYGARHLDDPVYIEYSTARDGGQWEADINSALQLQESVLAPAGDMTFSNIAGFNSLVDSGKGFFFEFYLDIVNNHASLGASNWLSRFGSLGTTKYAGKSFRIMWAPYYDHAGAPVTRVREEIYGLASYLLMSSPTTYFDPGDPMGNPDEHWFKAIEWVGGKDIDTGVPYPGIGNVSAAEPDSYQFASGQDPSMPTRNYYVFARKFDNGLVLLKPRPQFNSLYDDTSITTHNLPTYDLGGGQTSNRYYKLNNDGTIDSIPITSISLHNAEGAILIKETALNQPVISKSVDKATASSGETLNYTLSYSNPTAITYTNVRIEDVLPARTTFLSASNNGTFDGSKVIWNLGDLGPRSNSSVSFQVKVQ